MRMARLTSALLFPAICTSLAFAQSGGPDPRRTCPGDPAGNLASTDCSYTQKLRVESLLTSSITDEAMLGSVFYGTIAHVMNDPHEWGRGWTGFGDRVGTRYGQNLGKGLVEFTFGEIMKTDPRHISFINDPRIQPPAPGQPACTGTSTLDKDNNNKAAPTVPRRIGHAFMDFLTVRRSSVDGCGSRIFNAQVFAGSAASALVGDLWYPRSARSEQEISLRAAGSLATALGASFYTEFSPDVARVLGAIFKHGKTQPNPAMNGAPPASQSPGPSPGANPVPPKGSD